MLEARRIFESHDNAEEITRGAMAGRGFHNYEPRPLYVDYLFGRVMKMEFKDPLDFGLYIRDNGRSALLAAEEFALDLMTRRDGLGA